MDFAPKMDEEAAPHNERTQSELNQQNTPHDETTSPQTAGQYSDPASGLAEDLKRCDWDQLLERYAAAMEEHSLEDEEVRNQTGKLYEVR
ncbi:hypothetical protein PHISP_03124 [Aspergillus sp. HF37]|nr:hypothetical protein PHISP_03124 [Aspergillus sp. HF37]